MLASLATCQLPACPRPCNTPLPVCCYLWLPSQPVVSLPAASCYNVLSCLLLSLWLFFDVTLAVLVPHVFSKELAWLCFIFSVHSKELAADNCSCLLPPRSRLLPVFSPHQHFLRTAWVDFHCLYFMTSYNGERNF